VSGEVGYTVNNILDTRTFIKAVKLRRLAVTSTRRSPAMPDVPLFGEQGYPALDRFTGWWGVFAPAGTSPATIDQIAAAFNEALRDPNIRKRIEGANAEPTGTTPAEFTQIVRIDLAPAAALAASDSRDSAVFAGDAAADPRIAEAVEQPAVADHDVVGELLSRHGRPWGRRRGTKCRGEPEHR